MRLSPFQDGRICAPRLTGALSVLAPSWRSARWCTVCAPHPATPRAWLAAPPGSARTRSWTLQGTTTSAHTLIPCQHMKKSYFKVRLPALIAVLC